MSYFTRFSYVDEQHRALLTSKETVTNAQIGSLHLLDAKTPLFVFVLDIERSLDIGARLSAHERDLLFLNLCLIAATDAVSRGGVYVRHTDGIEVLFPTAESAVRCAIALARRQRQIQERVFSAVLSGRGERTLGLQAIDPASIAYRLLVAQFPADRKVSAIRDSGGQSRVVFERMTRAWFEACSRYGNKEPFLITKSVLRQLRGTGLESAFSSTTVPFKPRDGAVTNVVAEFFGDELYTYDPLEMPARETSRDITSGFARLTAQQVEESCRQAWQQRQDTYRPERPWRELATYFEIERPEHSSSRLKAVVIGDVNVDYVTYLTPDAHKQLTGGGKIRHIQLRQDVLRQVGGKGLLIAQALAATQDFDPVVLLAKLGMDVELQHVLENLAARDRIEPIVFLSRRLPTGTSISLRLAGEETAVATITESLSANTDLAWEEVSQHLPEILSAEYLFVSGYCLLDESRLEVVRRLLEKRIARLDAVDARYRWPRLVLEVSPRTLFSALEERAPTVGESVLKELLGQVFFLAYEEGAISGYEKLIADIPYRLSYDYGARRTLLVTKEAPRGIEEVFSAGESRVPWKSRPGTIAKRGSYGLSSRLIAEKFCREIVRPKVLLCSQSPRRFDLLAAVYGKSAIFKYGGSVSPEFSTDAFVDRRHLISELRRVTITKLAESLDKLRNDHNVSCAKLQSIKVALASDLVVGLEENAVWRVLEKPEHSTDAVREVRDYLERRLSGRGQEVWSCSAFLGFEDMVIDDETWNTELTDAVVTNLRRVATEEREIALLEDGDIGEVKVSLLSDGSRQLRLLLCKSTVEFRNLQNDELEEYVACSEWRTKAGGYAIQGCGGYFVRKIGGSFTNVMGFPIVEVERILSEFRI